LFHDYHFKINAYREPNGSDLDNISSNNLLTSQLPHFRFLPAIGGDLDWDLQVGLSDAVAALQTASGLDVDEINLAADVDGDQKMGLAEATFALQAVAQIRDTGYNSTHLSGVWLVVPETTGVPESYLVFDGAGNIEEFGAFNMEAPPGTYVVNPDGTFTVTVNDIFNTVFTADGQLLSDEIGSVEFDDGIANLYKLNDLSVCQGSWSGDLTEYGTNDPYSLAFTVDPQGQLTYQGGALPGPFEGRMLSWHGFVTAFFETGYTPQQNIYNQIQLGGTLTGNTINGIYEVDNGPEDDGSFMLNRQ